ncbi:MAG TPA: DMT family transporter, partial [Stellaceae bacterium]|nr:DMT family transporter [Stellaceae bacterium]
TTLLSTLLLPFGWETPSWQGMIGLASIGLASGLGQFLWTQAFRLAPAAVLAPFNYTTMIWAIGFGYFMWGEMPTSMVLLGTAVVVGSGLYILYRETVRRAVQPATLAAASSGSS